jgi:hypothetical protein
MNKCPTCGRTLAPGEVCPKCGPGRRNDWYALAEEADQKEASQKSSGKSQPPQKKASSSQNRADWYAAAGQEVPDDEKAPPLDIVGKGKRAHRAVDPSKEEQLLQISQGRKDPPWMMIGLGVGGLTIASLLGYVAMHKPAEENAPQPSLPMKNVQVNKSYGFKVTPPEGFRQEVVSDPEWLRGVHSELTTSIFYRNSVAHVDAYYFGEMRKGVELDQYAKLGVDGLGKVTPLSAIPEGLSGYKAKGYLIEMEDPKLKGLYYVAAGKDSRFLSVYALTSADQFDKNKDTLEAAARALSVIEPTGPHPDKQFSPTDPP